MTSYIEAFYKRDFVIDIPEELYQLILEKSLTSTSREQYATHKSGALSVRLNHFPATTSLLEQAILRLQNHHNIEGATTLTTGHTG